MIAICDTAPLLAFLNRNDPHHAWAVALLKQVRAPMLVCEPVDALFQLLERGAMRLKFDISAHWARIRALMSRYRQMADASIVVVGTIAR